MKDRSPYQTKVMIRTPFLFVPSKGMVISQMFFATYVSKLLLFMSERYCPQNVCKLQSSYICGEIANQTKNNEAYNGTKIGNYFGNGLE